MERRSMQWAAVKTWLSLIRAPPQSGLDQAVGIGAQRILVLVAKISLFDFCLHRDEIAFFTETQIHPPNNFTFIARYQFLGLTLGGHHRCKLPGSGANFRSTIAAIHGYSFTSVLEPPMILRRLLSFPQTKFRNCNTKTFQFVFIRIPLAAFSRRNRQVVGTLCPSTSL